jgi:hypothetical protein
MKKCLGLLLFLLPAIGALANQANTPIGFGFANACAGDAYFGSLPNPGDGFSTVNDQFMSCVTNIGSVALASSMNGGVVNGNSYSNHASAIAGPGFIQVAADNSGTQAVPFPGGAGYGGWNDSIVVGGGNGSAVLLVPITVQGTLSAVGIGGLTRVGVNAYQNHGFLQPYGDALHAFAYDAFLLANGGPNGIRNSAIFFSWDYQGTFFGADDYGPNDPLTLQNYSLNRTLYFAFPFTYGVPFEVGFYAGGVAGELSSGGGSTPNSSSYDFAHSITWGGPGQVIDLNNQTNPNFTITSQSGFNYNQPFTSVVPEPPMASALGLALAGLLWLKLQLRSRLWGRCRQPQ